jgi:hypothetical protein
MAKLRSITDDELKAHLHYEMKFNRERMKSLESEWFVADNIYQSVIGRLSEGGVDADTAIRELFQRNMPAEDKPILNSTALARAMMFLHSKLCITEPTVVVRPFRRDWDTKQSAELAQLWCEHIREATNLQEILESGPYLNTVTKGMGIVYIGWNHDGGEPLDVPDNLQPGQEFQMSGDFALRSVSPKNFYIDSTAKYYKDAECVIEKCDNISASRFMYEFNRPDILDKMLSDRGGSGDGYRVEDGKKKSNNSVTVYYYWEKALPWNGLLGSHVIFVEIGDEPGDIEILYRGENPLQHRQLPYAVMSDLDIDENPYGMSRAIHCAHHLDILNLFLSMVIENIEINGIPRVMAPEGSTDDALQVADLAKIVHYNPASGGQVYHLKPSPITTDVWRLVEILTKEIDSVYGQGEFSKGEIPRELSSYAVQLGIEMDDKFRIRLFNKKRMFLKTIYSQSLSNAQQYCKEPRKLQVSGFKSKHKYAYFNATDTIGEHGVYVEYGKYMPIDPSARKQMVLEMINSGAYEKAGGNPRKLFKVLLDGDMFDLTEVFENAVDIQNSEIVDIIENNRQVDVQPWHEHTAHMEALQDLFAEALFEELPSEVKTRLWEHYTTHETQFAEQAAAAQQAQPQQGQPGATGEMGLPQSMAGVEAGGQGIVPEPGMAA